MGCTASAIWERATSPTTSAIIRINPVRLDLTMRLARELGVLDQVESLAAAPADEAALLTVHDADYLDAVRGASAGPDLQRLRARHRPTTRCSPGCTRRPR